MGKMKELYMDKMDEQILVVHRDYLFEDEGLTFQGVLTDENKVKHIMGKFKNYFEVRRGDAEDNTTWKQPIPYAIIKRGDRVFLYKRLKAGGETRLHGQLSIGIGGHMALAYSIRDWDFILTNNFYRELFEELNIEIHVPFNAEPKIIGLINDDEQEVGRMHIGILAVIELPEEAEVTVRETDTLEGSWIHIKDLRKTPLFESLETWSQMAVDVL